MQWFGLLTLTLFELLAQGGPVTASDFQPVRLQLDRTVPLLFQQYPHRVASFHPAERELRVAAFDREKALFVVDESTTAAGATFLVEGEAVGLHPPISFPLDRDVEIEVFGGPGASYVLYLPPGYSQDKPPPLVFAFPPLGNGKRFIQPLKASARRLGWVLIGCNGLNNGRNEVFFPTARAIIQDARRRIVHDRTREVLLGFSGGAMASYRLSRVFWDEFSGVVALGGWLGVYEDHLVYPSRLAVAMLNGNQDAGARENEKRDRKILGESGVSSKVFRFRGGHTVPPEATIDKALDWLQERWKRQPPRAGNAQEILERAVRLSVSGRVNRAAEFCLDLILSYARSWQAQAAEDLLAWLLVDSRPGSQLELEPRPDDVAMVLYGKARGVSSQPSRTVAYLDAALLLAPDNGLIQSRLAFELFRREPGSRRARQLADKAVATSPDHWLAHFVKGLLYEADGDRISAVEEVRRARRLAPNALQQLCSQTLKQWGVE